MRRSLLASTAVSAVLASLGLAPAAAKTLPQGGSVVAGQASIRQTAPNRLDIAQRSDRAAINWQSFSIGAGARVDIAQPSAGSISLNQVVGAEPSRIFGQLTSNGRVVIANPNGIWFGAGSRVDVAGIVATASRISDQAMRDFAAGAPLVFAPGRADAAVVNEGTITVAQGGLAALVAPGVRNAGVIEARLGRVELASGAAATLDFHGDGLVSFAVTDPATARATGADGRKLAAAVENSGRITADGGTVRLTAQAAKGVLDQVINMGGVVEARAISTQGGEIVLDGGADGAVMVAGRLDASGRGADAQGGRIEVLGDKVALLQGARLDASGARGGGTVLVGGPPEGEGTARRAAATVVEAGAVIAVDALAMGSGGNVVLWSEKYTRFAGAISARGGALGGDGGRVETSSRTTLETTGTIDAAAPRGRPGTWLLDPSNVTIANAATANESESGGTPDIFTPAADATVNAAQIATSLGRGTSVTIATNAGSGPGSGDINVNAVIAPTMSFNGSATTATLTLNAVGNLTVASTGGIGAAVPAGGALDLAFTAGKAATINGAITGVANVTGTAAGDITLGSQIQGFRSTSNTTKALSLTSTGGNLALQPAGSIASVAAPGVTGGGFDVALKAGSAKTLTIAGSISAVRNLTVDFTAVGRSTIVVNTPTIQTTGSQSYNSALALRLDQNVTMSSSGGGNITFNETVNALTAGVQGLIVNTNGTTKFASAIGNSAVLGSLATDAGGTTLIAGSLVKTGGAIGTQTFNDDVQIGGANTVLTATGAIQFNGSLDSDTTPRALVITAPTTTFRKNVGSTSPLASLQVGAATLTGNVTTSGAQTFGAMTLAGDATLRSNNGLGIQLASVDGGFALTTDTAGTTSLGGAVGAATKLARLTIANAAGTTTIAGPSVATTGSQSYANAVTLSASGARAFSGSSLSFGKTLDGAVDLTLAGAASFAGSVGGITRLASLSAQSVSTSGTLSILSTGALSLGDTSIGAGTTLTLAPGAGALTLASTNSATGRLAVSGTGAATLGPAVSVATLDLTGKTGGSVVVHNLAATTLSVGTGAYALTLDGTGSVASGVAFGNAGALTLGTAASDSLTFTNGLTRAGGVSLAGTIASPSGAASFGSATLAATTAVTSAGGKDIAFGTVTGPAGLVVGTAGATSFAGAVSVAALTTDAPGSTSLGGNVITTGGQSYGDAVTLAGSGIRTLAGSSLAFGKTLEGAVDLTLAGPASFGGSFTGLSSLSAQGVTTTATLGVTTTGALSLGAASIGAGTTLTLAPGAGTLTVASVSPTTGTLAVTGSGDATLGPAVSVATLDFSGKTSGSAVVHDLMATTLATGTGAYALTLDGIGTVANAVAFDNAGVLTLGSPTSSLTFAGGLLRSGPVSLGGTIATPGGAASFGDAILFADAVATSVGGKDVTFAGTLDGAASLIVNTAGTTSFAGAVGGTTPLASLTTDAPGTVRIGGNVTTIGAQSFGEAATLTANATLAGSAIAFGNSLDGGFALTMSGPTTLGGSVGGTTPLAAFTAQDVTTTAPLTIRTADGAISLGSTILGGDLALAPGAGSVSLASVAGAAATLSASGSGAVTLGTLPAGKVVLAGLHLSGKTDGTAVVHNPVLGALTTGTGAYDITLDGTGAVTNAVAFDNTGALTLGSLVFQGGLTKASGATTLTGPITSGGAIAFGTVALAADVILSGASLTLSGPADSDAAAARSLTLNSAGATVIAGPVGGTRALRTLTTDASGTTELRGNVTTTDGQSYGDAVRVTANAALTSSGGKDVVFAGTIDGPAVLTVDTAGATVFSGAVGGTTPLASLTTDAPGTVRIGGNVTTTGAQSFGEIATLTADTMLTGGSIAFGNSVDGAFALTLAGPATLGGSVGGTTPLTAFAARDVTSAASLVIRTADGPLSTGTLVVGAGTTATLDPGAGTLTLAAVAGPRGALTVGGSGAADLGASATLGTLAFTKTAGAASVHDLTATSLTTGTGAYDLTLDGTGSVANSVVFDNGGTLTLGSPGGSLAFGGGLTRNSAATLAGTISAGGPVVLGATTLRGDTVLSGASLTLAGPVDSDALTARSLALDSAGATRIGAALGGSHALASLTTDAGGTTELAGDVTTTGRQNYGDAVLVTGGRTLTGTDIGFATRVDGPGALTANAAGTTSFAGAVGAGAALAGLVTDAGGATILNGGAVTSAGAVVFGDAVVLGADTTITAASATFAQIDSDGVAAPRALAANAPGATRFLGAVGATAPLRSLATDAAGTTELAAPVTTAGAQSFADAVRVTAPTLLTSTGSGAVTFGGALDGPAALSIRTGGVFGFGGAIGGTSPLAALTLVGAGQDVAFGGMPISLGAFAASGVRDVAFAAPISVGSFDIAASGAVKLVSPMVTGNLEVGSLTLADGSVVRITGTIGGSAVPDSLHVDLDSMPGGAVAPLVGSTATAVFTGDLTNLKNGSFTLNSLPFFTIAAAAPQLPAATGASGGANPVRNGTFEVFTNALGSPLSAASGVPTTRGGTTSLGGTAVASSSGDDVAAALGAIAPAAGPGGDGGEIVLPAADEAAGDDEYTTKGVHRCGNHYLTGGRQPSCSPGPIRR